MNSIRLDHIGMNGNKLLWTDRVAIMKVKEGQAVPNAS